MKAVFTLLLFADIFLMFTPGYASPNSVNFEKVNIQVGNVNLWVLLADTPEKSQIGLMNRKSIKKNEGMLFTFESSEILSFWMKNTFVNISIGFFSEDKILREICDMKASKSELQSQVDTCVSSKPAQYALEMRLGWFTKNKIKVGDKLKIFNKK